MHPAHQMATRFVVCLRVTSDCDVLVQRNAGGGAWTIPLEMNLHVGKDMRAGRAAVTTCSVHVLRRRALRGQHRSAVAALPRARSQDRGDPDRSFLLRHRVGDDACSPASAPVG